jgi:hypothetical protein
MREPKTLVEKVWEQHVVPGAEGERAAHLRRACVRLGYCQRFCHKSFGLWPQDSS